MILLILFGLLVGSYLFVAAVDAILGAGALEPALRGRISLAILLVFTGMGHFLRTVPMAMMIPDWVPARVLVVYGTGMLEWLIAMGLLFRPTHRIAGLALVLLLVAVFPANVNAALNRIPIAGHELGPTYLLIRGPFQILLIVWTYWFALRRRPREVSSR